MKSHVDTVLTHFELTSYLSKKKNVVEAKTEYYATHTVTGWSSGFDFEKKTALKHNAQDNKLILPN